MKGSYEEFCRGQLAREVGRGDAAALLDQPGDAMHTEAPDRNEFARGREGGLNDGWNDALDALIPRLEGAAEALEEMAEHKRDMGGSDFDRLRGKRVGVLLALDYARSMKR